MVEAFKGTNGIPYNMLLCWTLFVSAGSKIDSNNHEVGDIGWFSLKKHFH